MPNQFTRWIVTACLAGLLAACGGGGGSSSTAAPAPPPNNPPPNNPPPDPTPPPPASGVLPACPGSSSSGAVAAPVIPSRNFDIDCMGEPASVETPLPGVWRHVKTISGHVVCVRDTVDDPGDVVIEGSDIVYLMEPGTFFPGDVVFRGSRVQWVGGSIGGNYVCNGCSDVVLQVPAIAAGDACQL